MMPISTTDLILNPDGSIYHLNLLPEDIADTVITVGDPERVAEISKHFDYVELKKGKREFVTHTGYIGKNRLSVISTGIGTDNIDIVLNELDALVNIDFVSRVSKNQLTSLNIIRIGTSGTIQKDIPVDTILVSEFALGLDSLMHYYTQKLSVAERELQSSIQSHLRTSAISGYLAAADQALMERIGKGLIRGITVTAPGFYAPQGRQLRTENKTPNLIHSLSEFRFKRHRITNLEMETAGIYALARCLGHRALSVNAILANRVNFDFSRNPSNAVEKAILNVLSNIF